ncbi:hypothetical protein Micbo1qcDRAFT_181118 [Microdochium bolleyi]|uniref:Uncharacterized protein n=1 Tax=Microdochium bolleyi TaxID=196109 RepID=A0A136IJE3_9PEZI|nr:hypothetical protein Micbo1qcDRAFT_181118 [Microdochium bolleyi]
MAGCALVPRGFEFRGWGSVATEWWVGFPSADSSHRAPPVRVAYKNLCFGGFVQTWEQALALVERVAMPHLGLLPDTFNMAGAVWADPAAADGERLAPWEVWPVIYAAATKWRC